MTYTPRVDTVKTPKVGDVFFYTISKWCWIYVITKVVDGDHLLGYCFSTITSEWSGQNTYHPGDFDGEEIHYLGNCEATKFEMDSFLKERIVNAK